MCFHFFPVHWVLPSSKSGLRCETNKCMQQMDLKLWAPNLTVEARAEFTLLKWPTESSHAVWKYTKQKGDVPRGRTCYSCWVIFVLITSSLGIPPHVTPGCLRFLWLLIVVCASDSGREDLGQEQAETSQDPLAILPWKLDIGECHAE